MLFWYEYDKIKIKINKNGVRITTITVTFFGTIPMKMFGMQYLPLKHYHSSMGIEKKLKVF
jgi:hypothetical protein